MGPSVDEIETIEKFKQTDDYTQTTRMRRIKYLMKCGHHVLEAAKIVDALFEE
jgi:hypothetical protein